jgi:hypothetical protein
MRYLIVILFSVLVVSGCTKLKKTSANSAISNCIKHSIDSALSKPKGSLFIQIDKFLYKNNDVYLYYSGCCDRFNDLKDENCNYLFSPSGGFSGGGDGTHSTFFTEAKLVSTLWKDPRP